MRTRQPAVAGRFYSGHPQTLKKEVRELLSPYALVPKKDAFAVVSPHAGYMYSGPVAAETLSSVDLPETIVIIGLNHHGRGEAAALSCIPWDMVSDTVKNDSDFSNRLLSNTTIIREDDVAHRYEHSVEVQIPFLMELQPKIKIVPLVLSHLPYNKCEEIAVNLAATINDYPDKVLLLASSDMSHYESRTTAQQKDQLALDQIEHLNPRGLYDTVHQNRISMCGVIPVTVALLTSLQLGAKKAEVLRYTDSGEASGDTSQVVGYAGIVIS